MGLWPLKDMQYAYQIFMARFRPLMGLWPLKGTMLLCSICGTYVSVP